MFGIVGIVVVFAMVFGGYVVAGGKLEIIMHSAPHEMIIIFGAAIGAFVIGNDKHGIVSTLKDIAKVFKGPHWKPRDFQDLLCLMFQLIRIARANPVELDQHIEDPDASAIFQAYPRILADHEAVALICDTLRSASMNYDDPHQVEEVPRSASRSTTPRRSTRRMRCRPWPTACRRSASSRRCSA